MNEVEHVAMPDAGTPLRVTVLMDADVIEMFDGSEVPMPRDRRPHTVRVSWVEMGAERQLVILSPTDVRFV